jgi:hypothetical protein
MIGLFDSIVLKLVIMPPFLAMVAPLPAVRQQCH